MSAPTITLAPRPQGDERAETPREGGAPPKIVVRDLNFFYGRTQALHGISLGIP